MATLNNLSEYKKSARLNLRILPQRKRLIEQAASIEHTTPSEFIMRTVVERAEKVISEQCYFFVDEKKWEELCKAIDKPAREITALRKLADKKTVIE